MPLLYTRLWSRLGLYRPKGSREWHVQASAMSVTGEAGRAHHTEGTAQLLADPPGTFGKETDLLLEYSFAPLFGNGQFKRFSVVIQDGEVKVLRVGPRGTGP